VKHNEIAEGFFLNDRSRKYNKHNMHVCSFFIEKTWSGVLLVSAGLGCKDAHIS